ncbi:MAG: deoxyribodipyrimidine photo-lyase [Bacteroidetes bacterium]|nr:deoxyribodipyrimidine photo-lyase [Bacteroidota bacterium]
MTDICIFWLRRDLRVHDNRGFFAALESGLPVLPIFIFDKNILAELPKHDRRVDFIMQALVHLQKQFNSYGSGLLGIHDTPLQAFQTLLNQFSVQNVFTNHDYEPYARKRDTEIAAFLKSKHIEFHTYKDQVNLEKDEVLKEDASPYTVFTPYSKKWKSILKPADLHAYPSETKLARLYHNANLAPLPTLDDLGFEKTDMPFCPPLMDTAILANYHLSRDIPALKGTSQLSVHLRFGTISIRSLTALALQTNEKFLNELIWREFYQSILWHFPEVVSRSFKPKYDNISWRNNKEAFKNWCLGQTDYPLVDAGMRELNATGWMHNRVRMIVASFLCKHLLINWRWGEAYFAEKLIDFDLASNNGGWQWAAGCGVDAAPYFRIFNPYLQTQKFDPQWLYIRKWVPEVDSLLYPRPIVVHEVARRRCLEVYKQALHEEASLYPNLGDKI